MQNECDKEIKKTTIANETNKNVQITSCVSLRKLAIFLQIYDDK